MNTAPPPLEGRPLEFSGRSFFWLYHPRWIPLRDTVWNPPSLGPPGHFPTAASVQSTVRRFFPFSVRNRPRLLGGHSHPPAFPRLKARRIAPHGGLSLRFAGKQAGGEASIILPPFFPPPHSCLSFSFAFHSAPSCQSRFSRSASVPLRGQVTASALQPAGVLWCPECLSAQEAGHPCCLQERCHNGATVLTENKENGIKGAVFSHSENFFSMRCEKRISG